MELKTEDPMPGKNLKEQNFQCPMNTCMHSEIWVMGFTNVLPTSKNFYWLPHASVGILRRLVLPTLHASVRR